MDERPIDTLNVIPFVDIMLVLLTIVLTTASFIATGRIPIALPQASRSPVEKQKSETIDLAVSGAIYLDGKPVLLQDLEGALKPLPPDTAFLIRADRNLVFQKFVDVADLLKRLNFTTVTVETQTGSR
jgi:biopolymer transport protein ExbD